MKFDEAKKMLSVLQTSCENANKIAKVALKNRASLSGDGFYGRKFSEAILGISKAEADLEKLFKSYEPSGDENTKLKVCTSNLKSTKSAYAVRAGALNDLRLICHSEILPQLESLTVNPVPETEQVLPLSVINNTRGYIERVTTQANGCYERQWFDACSVMVRKLVEILIIEVYEAKKEEKRIKDGSDNFLMLGGLVDAILKENWNLGRETKAALPLIKSLGDRSAHNRRFMATQVDVKQIIPGLRVIVDDLLHLANLK